uniref:SRCR domain-containing protein n=1 Tax=Oryzias latipes TaxID=8090 RepID=A0A3P9LN34_ORYLA
MRFLLLLICSSTHIVSVAAQAKGKVILRGGENPCEGHVEIYYNNTAGHVGDKHWDGNTEKVVCRTTQCGVPVPGATKNVQRLENRTVWLNELRCSGNEDSLWDCPGYPAPGVSVYQKPTVKMIKCSGQIKISLEPHECHGVAKYSVSATHSGYFCKDNWGPKDTQTAELLCRSVGCGGLKEIPRARWVDMSNYERSEKMGVDCAGIDSVTNLWLCAGKPNQCRDPVVVTCEGHERLQLLGSPTNVCSGQLQQKKTKWEAVKNNINITDRLCTEVNCGTVKNYTYVDQNLHLTCTDTVKVVLMDGRRESPCFGRVHVNKNGLNQPVCGAGWTAENSHMVCKELRCGKLIEWTNKAPVGPGVMDDVNCSGNESSLWHCKARHGPQLTCQQTPHVICSGSVEFRLADGPGKCAGRLDVLHGGEWKRVAKSKWNEKYSDNICQRLNCGKTTGENHPERFFQGSGNFVSIACDRNQPDISECVKSEQNTLNVEAVGITCENHEVVFLKGSESCSGAVGIWQNNNTFWLSGSNETWNSEAAETLCQQMHCGRLTKFSSRPSAGDISDMTFRAYRCSGNQSSLFDCDKVELPDHNENIAQVECSGKINVSLSEGCWGKVRIIAEGKSEGVCSDSWTEEMSKTLCQETSCGEAVFKARKLPTREVVTFKSLHTVGNNSNLRESTFVKTEKRETCVPAYVICGGRENIRFRPSRDKCSGVVEAFYEGDWLPMSTNAAIRFGADYDFCEHQKCGKSENPPTRLGLPHDGEAITAIDCSGDGSKDAFKVCSISLTRNSNLGVQQCSDWSEMVLEEDGCKGEVAVYSQAGRMLVSSEGWTETEGNRLCKDLQCGKFKTKREVSGDDSFWNKTFKCPNDGKAESIWDCETETPPSLQRKKLFIECQDRSKVSLSGYCSGQVRINSSPVCNKNWDIDYSNRVCQELNCGNAFDHSDLPGAKSRLYVSCDQHHHVLGQCHRDEGKCQSSVSVSCYKNITFQTTEKCGGQVQVNYGRNWKNVCVDKNTLKNSKLLNSLCKEMNCEYNTNARLEKINEGIYLECPTDYNDIKYCVKAQPCGGQTHGLIIECAGFENTEPVMEKSDITVPLIVGIGTSLLVLILIPVFVRFWMVRRARKKALTKMLPDREADQDSESYDEIGQPEEKALKCESIFAEAAVIKEGDVQSSSSLEYDDVDKAPEAQPLTSQGSKGSQNVADQSDDGEMPEVDDLHPTEDGPANMQTTVEVHNEPKATAENSTGPPEDEDYLVPDQDG